MNFHLDKSRPDRLLAWKQVVRTLVAIIFHTKETWPHNARSSYKAVRKRLCAPFWTSQPYISVCLIMNGTMVNGGVHPAVAIFCHRRPWQCASRDTRNKKKKNKVDICIYGFGEKITNKKRNGSVFHTVWSYWLNTRVRIVRLKRKKMRVFFSFHLFFSFPFLLLLLFERSAGGRHRYTHAHCGCLSTPAVVAAPFSIQWNKPTKKTKTKGMRVTNDQTQWTEWIGEDSANYFRRYQSVKLIRDWLRFSSSVREQHLLHKNSFFLFLSFKNRIEQKKNPRVFRTTGGPSAPELCSILCFFFVHSQLTYVERCCCCFWFSGEIYVV